MVFNREFNPLISSTSSSDSESNNSEYDQVVHNPHPLSSSLLHSPSSLSHCHRRRDNRKSDSSPVISYHGQIRSLYDALLLIEAARLSKLPTIKRRLTAHERQKSIRPNNIFIWNESTSNIRRWTDGKLWSDSKLFNNHFLIYHEKVNDSSGAGDDKQKDCLVKQSLSLTTKDNEKFHLIYYFKKDQLQSLKNDRRRKKWLMRHENEEVDIDTDLNDDISSDNEQSDEDRFQVVHQHHGLHGKIPSKDAYLKDLSITDDVYPINFLKDVSLYSMKGSSHMNPASVSSTTIKSENHSPFSITSPVSSSMSNSTTTSGGPSLVPSNYTRTPITTISSPRTSTSSIGSILSIADTNITSSSTNSASRTIFNQANNLSPAITTSIVTDGKLLLPLPVTTFRSNYFDDRINTNDALALLMLDKCFA